jgi:hypothetical protein
LGGRESADRPDLRPSQTAPLPVNGRAEHFLQEVFGGSVRVLLELLADCLGLP